MSNETKSKEQARAEAKARRDLRSKTAIVKASSALSKYGTEQELAVMIDRFKFMLPGGSDMDEDAIKGLAQASFIYGLDPFLKEIHWIDGPAPGIRGLRRKGREWAEEHDLGVPDLRYEQITDQEDMIALEIPPGSLAYKCLGGFPRKLDAHAKRMREIREALGQDAPYTVILEQAGPRPETVGYGYLTPEEIHDKDHPLWWHICENADNNTARRKTWQPKDNGQGNYYGWAEVYELRARECPDCGEESWKAPSSYPHVQHAQKRAEAHWWKLACDLPFELGPGNAPPGERVELRGDEGVDIQNHPDLSHLEDDEMDEVARLAKEQGWGTEELMAYLDLKAQGEVVDGEIRDLDPDELKARSEEAAAALYGDDPDPDPDPDDDPGPSKRKNGPKPRPWPAETVRSKFQVTVEANKGARRDAKIGKMELWQYARWMLGECFGGDPQGDAKVHSVSAYLTGKDSAKDWTGAEAQAFIKWLDIDTSDPQDHKPSKEAKMEAKMVLQARLDELGVQELPGLESEE